MDVVARIVANEAGKTLGQPIVVENRPGAGATIGAAEVARVLDISERTVRRAWEKARLLLAQVLRD